MNLMMEVPYQLLVPPPEPLRATMTDEGMDLLVESIRAIGVMLPLLVTLAPSDAYDAKGLEGDALIKQHLAARAPFEIIDGHRRYIAAGRAEVHFLPCRTFAEAGEAKHAMMLHANIMREDVTPAEEGWQFLELAVKHQWSLDKLMRTFRVSENYINERVELVQKDPEIAQVVHERRINLAQAHELLREKDPERRHTRLLLALEHGYNAKELRVMRQNLESERASAQGDLIPHTPEYAPAPPPTDPPVCIWCGQGHDPENLRQISVHHYHLRELNAVVDKVGIKGLLSSTGKAAVGQE